MEKEGNKPPEHWRFFYFYREDVEKAKDSAEAIINLARKVVKVCEMNVITMPNTDEQIKTVEDQIRTLRAACEDADAPPLSKLKLLAVRKQEGGPGEGRRSPSESAAK